MANIEKVINGLEHCSSRLCPCDQCAYWNPNRTINDECCGEKLSRDAIELLKEQQAEIKALREEKEKTESNFIEYVDEKREEVEELNAKIKRLEFEEIHGMNDQRS